VHVPSTFERNDTLVDELARVAIPHEPAGARRPQSGARHADLLRGIVGKRHNGIGDDAGDRRYSGAGIIELGKKCLEVGQAGVHDGVAKVGEVQVDIGIG
jgi:hypothetical protein